MDNDNIDKVDILAIALSTLFGAYGKEKEIERMQIYYRALMELDSNIVHNACRKCLCNCTFLPSIAEIIKEVRSLEFEMHPENKIKSWDEVLYEITKAIENASPTQTIEWSTPEIAQAVRSYGFSNLCYGSDSSHSYGLELIRKNYIAICTRIHNNIQNKGFLGHKGGNILGIPNLSHSSISYDSNNTIIVSDMIKELDSKVKEGVI